MSLELTPYGKKKFADGEFSPEFYSFYDSDILYDGVYGNLYEEQNNIVSRITNKTVRLKPVARFTGSSHSRQCCKFYILQSSGAVKSMGTESSCLEY